MDAKINKEILQICRNIENEHKLNKGNYTYIVKDTVLPILPELIKNIEKVFSNSHITVDSLKRYIVIDWSKKE